jgi:uncharacterized protein
VNTDRIFIDTNTLLSGLVFPKGNERQLLRLAQKGRVRLVISEAVLLEAGDVIGRKWPEVAGELDELLETIDWEPVDYPPGRVVLSAAGIVRDPKDAPILATILLSKPDYAITGDNDLLTDEVRAVAPMCRCAEYLSKIQTKE